MMINTSRFSLLATMGLMLVLVLSGCDGGATAPPTEQAEQAGSAQQAEPAAPASVEAGELGETPNVHKAGDVLTAGQPPREAFGAARESGYRVVLDLRGEGEDRGFDERAVVEELGMEYVNPGFSSADALTDDVFDRSREILRASEQAPVLMHCASANRVGGVWLTYRVLDQGVPIEQAAEEAKTIGLRSEAILEKAKDYIERHQGASQ